MVPKAKGHRSQNWATADLRCGLDRSRLSIHSVHSTRALCIVGSGRAGNEKKTGLPLLVTGAQRSLIWLIHGT